MEPLMTSIISLVIVVLAAIGIVIYWYKNKPTDEQKQMARDFIESLYDSILDTVKNSISKKIISEDGKSTFYIDFEFFKNDLIDGVYQEVWSFVENAIEMQDTPIMKILSKLVTKDNVETLINTIVALPEVDDLISDQYTAQLQASYALIEKAEKEAVEFAEAVENGALDDGEVPEYEPEPLVPESNYPEAVDIDPADPTVEKID